MKKSLATVLAFLLLLQSCGLVIVSGVHKLLMREWLSDSHSSKNLSCVYLTLPSSAYKRHKIDKEISVNGQMFDILQTAKEGNLIRLTLVHDIGEDLIMDLIDELSDQEGAGGNKNTVKHSLVQDFIIEVQQVTGLPVLQQLKANVLLNKSALLDGFNRQVAPPPRPVFSFV